MEISVQEAQLNNSINEDIKEEVHQNLATIRKIKSLSPIEGADRIELATMENLGWQVVVQKGIHAVGDLVSYVQIDTLCPEAPWSEFLKDRHYRVRTIKLKKQLSQGLIIPLRDLQKEFETSAVKVNFEENFDLTNIIGVKKFEKPIPANLAGTIKSTFPSSIVPKTDEERVQNYPRLVEDINGLECYISVKMDGTSATYIHNDRDTHVCSRNMSLKEPAPEDKQNVYWDMEKKYKIVEQLKEKNVNFAVQGEICGPGIQGNKAGLTEVKLFVFNVYDIPNHKYLDFEALKDFCLTLKLDLVPIIGKTIFKDVTVQDLLTLSEGNYDNETPREGIVIRPIIETTSHAMRDSRLSFKVINNQFLLKYGE